MALPPLPLPKLPGPATIMPAAPVPSSPYPDVAPTMIRDAPAFSVLLVPGGSSPKTPGVPVNVTDRILSFVYDEEDVLADKLELRLNNFDLGVFDDPNWIKGNTLIVSWGYAGNMCQPRTVVIQEITGSIQLTVKAYARTILMNKKKQSVVFKNQRHSDIVGRIAAAHGYSPSQQFIDDTILNMDATHQANLTDAEFLKHLAAKQGFIFYVDIDGLHWERRKVGAAPVRTMVWYNDPGQGDILSWNLENDVTATPSSVTAVGRTPNKKPIKEEASNDETARVCLAPVVEVLDPDTPGSFSISLNTETTVLSNAPTPAAAKREADGKFIQAQQIVAKLMLQCVGDPSIHVRQILVILNISKRLSGRYYVAKATHTITSDAYTMQLGVRSDGNHGNHGPAPTKGHVNQKPPVDDTVLAPKEIIDGDSSFTIYAPDSAGGGSGGS